MKKLSKSIVAMALAFAATTSFAAVDSYLYWMAGSEVQNANNSSLTYNYDYATVRFDDSSSYLSFYNADNINTGAYGLDKGNSGYVGFDSTSLPATFLFELWNDSLTPGTDDAIASWSVSSSDLASFIGTARSQIGSAYALTQAVPEPTSGLLMLLGMAGLALRRKRAA